MSGAMEPIEVTITVRSSVEDAFRTFTSGIDRWWPKHSHSVGRETTSRVVMESRAGGDLYELTADGARHDWGVILEWEPPHRVVFSWHPGQPAELEQRVEIRFRYTGDVTEVRLIHSGWEALGDRAAAARSNYASGWRLVLGEHYRAFANADQEVSR